MGGYPLSWTVSLSQMHSHKVSTCTEIKIKLIDYVLVNVKFFCRSKNMEIPPLHRRFLQQNLRSVFVSDLSAEELLQKDLVEVPDLIIITVQ